MVSATTHSNLTPKKEGMQVHFHSELPFFMCSEALQNLILL